MQRAKSFGAASRQVMLGISWLMLAGQMLVVQADVTREASEPILRLDVAGHTGEVRALAFSADSTRLFSGGRDKVAIVWKIAPEEADDGGEPRLSRDIARRRLKSRVMRWQVARGTRGAIQALATSPGNDTRVVALAGSGAMGSTGEILLLDAADGALVATLGGGERVGHRQSVAALEFTADGSWLVSQDLDGQLFAWQRSADWKPVELAAREEVRLGREAALGLQRLPPVRPLAAIGNNRVACGRVVSPPGAAETLWRIQILDCNRPEAAPQELPTDHRGLVTALSATPDGRLLASADLAGRITVAPVRAGGAPVQWSVKPVAEGLALVPDGSRLAIAVAAGDAANPPRVEIFDAQTGQLQRTLSAESSVRAVRVSPDGRWLAWSGGPRHAVFVQGLDDGGARQGPAPLRLGGVGRNITRVAFSTAEADARQAAAGEAVEPAAGRVERRVVRRRQEKQEAAPPPGNWPRRLAIGTAAGREGAVPALETAFSLEALAASPLGAEADWAPAAGRPAGWTLTRAAAADTPRGMERWSLTQAGIARGQIDLALDWQGRAGAEGTALCWLTRTAETEPWGVALGTDRGIFLYALDAAAGAPCRLVRRCRGHEDRTLSLAVSEDGRWLASGGADALVMLWPLADCDRAGPLADRWGVGLRVENGRAVVDTVDGAGPLAGKDVRPGDVILKISHADGAAAATEQTDGAAIRQALIDIPWNTQVSFATEREGKAQEIFQRYPAWEHLSALHLAANREWAYWTPRGYYAASANGDTLFGWLVNRGLNKLPRFFKAQQFRRKLERPDVMSKLLEAGSLDAALKAKGRDLPASSAIVLPQQIAQAPEVRIISPRPGEQAQGNTITVTAEVEIPAGVEIERVRAYASGAVASGEPRVVEERAAEGERPRVTVYAWDVGLPAEDQHLLQVFAGTKEGPTDAYQVTVQTALAPVPPRGPRLYLLASGVDRYAHAEQFAEIGLTNLTCAVKDASAVRDSLAERSLDLYTLAADRLLADGEVTRDGWRTTAEHLVASVAGEVLPDDLLVVFLAGHGMVRADAGRSYAYLCHDAAFEPVAASGDQDPVPVAAGTLSWQDFRSLAALPCRKLAIVDTCHSGALGPGARSATVREFQENMIVVLAAAADDEPSQESDAWGHGAFTKVLLEALEGRADRGRSRRASPLLAPQPPTGPQAASPGQPDGIVSLDEIIDYVTQQVPSLTRVGADEHTAQHPTVSPEDLVPFVRLPLTRGGSVNR